MSDEVLTSDDRRLVTARVTLEMWSELNRIRNERKWTWQVFLVDIFERYIAAYKQRQSATK